MRQQKSSPEAPHRPLEMTGLAASSTAETETEQPHNLSVYQPRILPMLLMLLMQWLLLSLFIAFIQLPSLDSKQQRLLRIQLSTHLPIVDVHRITSHPMPSSPIIPVLPLHLPPLQS